MNYLLDKSKLPILKDINKKERRDIVLDIRTHDTLSQKYYDIRDLRQSLRKKEREGIIQTAHEWLPIVNTTQQWLAVTNDLEFLSWLLEALVREYGLE